MRHVDVSLGEGGALGRAPGDGAEVELPVRAVRQAGVHLISPLAGSAERASSAAGRAGRAHGAPAADGAGSAAAAAPVAAPQPVTADVPAGADRGAAPGVHRPQNAGRSGRSARAARSARPGGPRGGRQEGGAHGGGFHRRAPRCQAVAGGVDPVLGRRRAVRLPGHDPVRPRRHDASLRGRRRVLQGEPARRALDDAHGRPGCAHAVHARKVWRPRPVPGHPRGAEDVPVRAAGEAIPVQDLGCDLGARVRLLRRVLRGVARRRPVPRLRAEGGVLRVRRDGAHRPAVARRAAEGVPVVLEGDLPAARRSAQSARPVVHARDGREPGGGGSATRRAF